MGFRAKSKYYQRVTFHMEPRRRYKMASQEKVEQAVYRLTPAGTQEIADLIGLSRQYTAHRLRALDFREKI